MLRLKAAKIMCASFLLCSYIQAGVVICSIPKCGSNLLKALLEDLGYQYKGNDVCHGTYLRLTEEGVRRDIVGKKTCAISHAIPTQENIDILRRTGQKAIFIYRDPRDCVLSTANYMKRLHGGRFWIAAQLPLDELVTTLIIDYSVKGKTYKKGLWSDVVFDDMGSVRDFYDMYLPWLDCPHVYCTSFEKLVGSKGGGSDEVQFQEISNICDYLGLQKTPEQIKRLCDNLFGSKKSLTFSKGLIGLWKTNFTAEQKEIFKCVANDLLIELGYEENGSW